MSALGDYVHLNTENYIKYGVNRSKSGKNYSYCSIKKDFLKKRINDGLGQNQDIDEKILNKIQKHASANSNAKNEKAKQKDEKHFQEILEQIYTILATMTNQNLLASLNKNSAYALKNKQVFQEIRAKAMPEKVLKAKVNARRDLATLYQNINNRKNHAATETDLKEAERLLGIMDKIFQRSSENDLEDIANALSEIVYDNQLNTLKGDFGEYLIAMCDDQIHKLAKTNVEEAVNLASKHIKGNIMSDSILDIKDVVVEGVDLQEYAPEVFKKSQRQELSETQYFLGKTKDKVDVQIQINKQDIFASVKNYNLKIHNKIKLQKTSSFLSLLVLQQYYNDFGNHWLNMHAANMSLRERESDKEDADEVLSQEMAYEALVSGNPLKENATHANVFVIIDSYAGKVYAQSTKTILTEGFKNFIFEPLVSHIKLSNQKADTFEERIGRLLVQAHKLKVHVSYAAPIPEVKT